MLKGNDSPSQASASNKPPAKNTPASKGSQTALNTSPATDDESFSIGSRTEREKSHHVLNKPTSSQSANPSAQNSGLQKNKLDDLSVIEKLRRKRSQGGFVQVGMAEAEIAKKKQKIAKNGSKPIDEATALDCESHVKKLTLLMSGENTEDNAEKVYKKVAKICTDPKLTDSLKLSCLLGKQGEPCTTLKADVNAYFDARILECYIENHAPKIAVKVKEVRERRRAEENKQHLAEQERKKLASKDNENGNDGKMSVENDEKDIVPDRSLFHWGPVDEEQTALRKFKATLSWRERWKIDNFKPGGLKNGWDYVEKYNMERNELLRKMQKRLTVEERADIRKDAKTYHDILANSGLPLLHIVIKNESVDLVRAYLLAVMAFAPLNIKKEAIQAIQYQNLQAFYYAMTHSTTTMIKMFMEEILYSEFLSDKDKEEILHARRPDKLKNGTFGIGAFYMAMGLGDTAWADIFMSTLLGWDPNCEKWEYSEMKVNLLLGLKSFHFNDMAKHAAREHGHKKLVKRYDQFVGSSLLSIDQKDHLYYCIKEPVPEFHEQPNPRKWTAQDEGTRQVIWETLKMPTSLNELSKPVQVTSKLAVTHFTKDDFRILAEQRNDRMKAPVPKDRERYRAQKFIQLPFTNLKDAGDYASLSTFPKQGEPEKKRRTDDDIWIGTPPATSKQAKKNTWAARAASGTLPLRSSSYASGLVKLPPAPSSLPILPRVEELTPKKRTPSTEGRTGKQTGLSNGTPTKLASGNNPKSDRSDSGHFPGSGQTRQGVKPLRPSRRNKSI